MSYSQMLSEIIEESGLSLRQISRRCSDLELNITPSYISQLKNGKLPPPSEEVSLVLAKVCGSKNQAKLVFQGYIEKAPQLVREYMLASSALNKIMLQTLCQTDNNGPLSSELKKHIEAMDVLSTLDLTSRFVNAQTSSAARDLIRDITLASGEAVKSDALGQMINMFASDDSMSPLIPSHAYLYILPTKKELLKNRDVIAIHPEGRKIPTLRRLFFIGEQILLVPDNKNQQIYIHQNFNEIDYIGKLVSYKIDL